MEALPFVATLSIIAGSICIYLSSPNQHWLKHSLSPQVCFIGLCLLAVSFFLFWKSFQPVVAVAVWMTTSLFVLVTLPYLESIKKIHWGSGHHNWGQRHRGAK